MRNGIDCLVPGGARGPVPVTGQGDEGHMTPHAKWAIGGVVLGLILLIISPWLALAVIALAIAVPAAAYAMLDPSQRRRLKEARRRRQLGG